MHTIKFILKKYFCFTFLIAAECTNSNTKANVPPTSIPEDQKKNSSAPIAIKSTGAHAVVCIGSNNIIHIGKTDQKPEQNKKIESLNTPPANQNNIPPQDGPITIESTDPDGTVFIGSNNTIYRHMPTPQQQQTTIRNGSNKEEEEEEEEEETD